VPDRPAKPKVGVRAEAGLPIDIAQLLLRNIREEPRASRNEIFQWLEL